MGKLTPQQEAFLAKYLKSGAKLSRSEKSANAKTTKEYKAYLAQLEKISAFVAQLPPMNTDRQDLQKALIASESDAAAGEFKAAKARLKSITKDAKAAVKKAAAIAKERAKQQEKAKSQSKVMKDAPVDASVSGPTQTKGPGDTNVGRVRNLMIDQGAASDGVMAEFTALNAKLKSLNPTLTEPHTGPEGKFAADMQALRSEFMALSLGDARNADGLTGSEKESAEAALKQKLDDLSARQAKLVSEAKATLTTLTANPEEAVRDALREQASEKAQSDYLALRAKLGPRVDRLADWGADDADTLVAKFANDAPKTMDDYSAGLAALAKLEMDIKAAETAHKTQYENDTAPAEMLMTAQKAALTSLRSKPAGKALKTEHVEALETQFDIIESILSSGQNPDAVAAAQAMLDAAGKTLIVYENADASIKEIEDALSTIKKSLGSKSNKSLRPEHNAALQEELDALTEGWKTKPLDTALSTAQDLLARTTTNADGYEKLCEKQALTRKTQDGLIDKIAKNIKLMDKVMAEISNGTIKKFEGDFLARFARAKDMITAESPEGIEAANRTIIELLGEIEGWIAGAKNPATRSDIMIDHLKGAKAADDEKRNKATFDAEYKAMEDLLKASRKAHGTPETNGEYDSIGTFLKSAKDLMDDPAGFAQAMRILGRVKAQITEIETRPKELDVKELARISKSWETAVKAVEDKLSESLLVKISTAAGVDEHGNSKLTDDTRSSLERTFNKALEALDPRAFDYAASLFTMADAEDGKALQGREEALRRIRVFREILANDPVMRAVVANPFGAGGVLTPVNTALRDLEHKAMVGV